MLQKNEPKKMKRYIIVSIETKIKMICDHILIITSNAYCSLDKVLLKEHKFVLLKWFKFGVSLITSRHKCTSTEYFSFAT